MTKINNKKRILIFSLAYLPFIGGAELAIKEITDRLREYEFDMLTLRFDSRLPLFERIGNVNIYRIGFSKKNPTSEELRQFPLYFVKIFYPPLSALRALFLHKKRKYDAVWAMMAYAGFCAVFFRLFARVPYILTLQEGDTIKYMTRRLRIRLFTPFLKMVFKTPSIIQTISVYLSDYGRSMGYCGEIKVIPNGADVEKFKNKNEKIKKKDKKSKIILITVSRLVTKNAVDDIIKALQFLPDNFVLKIIGTGPEEKNLRRIVKNLHLETSVLFLGDISHDILPDYLHTADIFIRPSRSEGMGSAFIEAMAAGLPVIGTPVGGIIDFLKDGETGLFCEVNNPESVAEQVKRLMNDVSLRESLVVNAFAMVKEKYDWSIIAKDMKEKIFNRTSDVRPLDNIY